MTFSTYTNTQNSLFCLLPYVAATTFFIVSPLHFMVGEPKLAAFFLVAGVLQALIGLSFQRLIIRDEGDGLSIRFGPLPIFKTHIAYADIQRIERERLAFVHVPKDKAFSWRFWRRDRMVWSLGCRDHVVIHGHNDSVRLGTYDADNLTGFLESKLPRMP